MFKNKKIGFGITGSFYTIKYIIPEIKKLIKMEAIIYPIMSFNSYKLAMKHENIKEYIKQIEIITKNKIIHTNLDAELIGSKYATDILIIAPCAGDTIGKLANGILDDPILIATKSHLKNEKNIVIGILTSDGLSGSAKNIRYFIK